MTITLAHGGGGRAMQRLIRECVLSHFRDPVLARLEDQASLPLSALGADADRLAFTTDSYVVDPLEFPGGDIGRLAVCGTVNDLAVGGARPLWLSCALIIEEGFAIERLDRLLASAAATAADCEVAIVAGDTKVVPRGAADGLFINTSGVGALVAGCVSSIHAARPGDAVLISGDIGRHGAAIVAARESLRLQAPIVSDCAPLTALCRGLLAASPQLRCMRDATRGGLAAVLNEIAEASACSIAVEEAGIPLSPAVEGLCELLGLDPLYLACEGRLVAVVPDAQADAAVRAMRALPGGEAAARIGAVGGGPAGRVSLATRFGGSRMVDMLVGEQLPRIC